MDSTKENLPGTFKGFTTDTENPFRYPDEESYALSAFQCFKSIFEPKEPTKYRSAISQSPEEVLSAQLRRSSVAADHIVERGVFKQLLGADVVLNLDPFKTQITQSGVEEKIVNELSKLLAPPEFVGFLFDPSYPIRRVCNSLTTNQIEWQVLYTKIAEYVSAPEVQRKLLCENLSSEINRLNNIVNFSKEKDNLAQNEGNSAKKQIEKYENILKLLNKKKTVSHTAQNSSLAA